MPPLSHFLNPPRPALCYRARSASQSQTKRRIGGLQAKTFPARQSICMPARLFSIAACAFALLASGCVYYGEKTSAAPTPACAFAPMAGGCVAHGFYVRSGHSRTGLRDLPPSDRLTPVRIEADYRMNGVPYPAGDAGMGEEIARVLRISHVLWPSNTAKATLTVVLDDVKDPRKERYGGYLTGMTQGLSGFHIDDQYVFIIVYKDASGLTRSGHYEHAIETAEGNLKPDSQWRAFQSPDEAFSVVVKQAMLDFLWDLQAVNDVDESILFVSADGTERD